MTPLRNKRDTDLKVIVKPSSRTLIGSGHQLSSDTALLSDAASLREDRDALLARHPIYVTRCFSPQVNIACARNETRDT